MALNIDPDPTGNIAMVQGLARVLTNDALHNHTGSRWMPHAATCERADAFRKPRKR